MPSLFRTCFLRDCESFYFSAPRYGICTGKCSPTLGRLDRIPHPATSRASGCVRRSSGASVSDSFCFDIRIPIPLDEKPCNTHSCYAQVLVVASCFVAERVTCEVLVRDLWCCLRSALVSCVRLFPYNVFTRA